MRSRSLIAVLLLCMLASAAASADRIAVIVHTERVAELDMEAIAQIYLKRRRTWPGGDVIVPINREAGSATRARFTERVLRLDDSSLALYWNREYFLGVLPPATLASDEAILRFVARDRRAIGYVDSSTVDDSVRVVLYID
jgi:ABC-type phosphate transport system substrate-binding protein